MTIANLTAMSDEDVLTHIDALRRRDAYCKSAADIAAVEADLIAAVEELVRRGVYPSQIGRRNTPLTMVKGWGARWHVWQEPLTCPHCSADLRSTTAGPPFKREIHHYSRELDRTISASCPDCGKIIQPN